jgi:hypothetical protein
VFAALLEGGSAQQLARRRASSTIEDRVRVALAFVEPS